LHSGAAWAAGAQAADDDTDKAISFSGFGTLGAVRNSNRQFDYARDLTQGGGAGNFPDVLISAWIPCWAPSLNARVNSSLQGALASDQPSPLRTAVYSPEVPPGLSANIPPNGQWRIRAGRLGFDVYMQADSRQHRLCEQLGAAAGRIFWQCNRFFQLNGAEPGTKVSACRRHWRVPKKFIRRTRQ